MLFKYFQLCLLVLLGVNARVEKATGTTFSDTMGFPSQALLGVGVRVKQVGPVAAKVYGVALYSSKGKVFERTKGWSTAMVKSKLADVVTEGTVVLKMVRDVASDTMASALADSVRPRLGGKGAAELEQLDALIKKGTANGCKKNTVLVFTCSGAAVGCTINGISQGSVRSSVLSTGLLSTYLDKQAVSPSLTDDVARTISSWNK